MNRPPGMNWLAPWIELGSWIAPCGAWQIWQFKPSRRWNADENREGQGFNLSPSAAKYDVTNDILQVKACKKVRRNCPFAPLFILFCHRYIHKWIALQAWIGLRHELSLAHELRLAAHDKYGNSNHGEGGTPTRIAKAKASIHHHPQQIWCNKRYFAG